MEKNFWLTCISICLLVVIFLHSVCAFPDNHNGYELYKRIPPWKEQTYSNHAFVFNTGIINGAIQPKDPGLDMLSPNFPENLLSSPAPNVP